MTNLIHVQVQPLYVIAEMFLFSELCSLTFICFSLKETHKNEETENIWFTFQKTKYIWEGEERKQFVGLQFPVDLQLRQYAEWRGYQEDADLVAAERKYNKNE